MKYSLTGAKRRSFLWVCGIIILLLLVVVGILSWKYYQTSKNTDNKQQTASRIIDKVKRLYLVPTSEEPTVALIQDKAKLNDQEFFKEARDGDYLLIYQKKRVALVYREEVNKLVKVGPVNIEQNNQKHKETTPTDQNP